MSGITKDELVAILEQKLEQKFEEKFKTLEDKLKLHSQQLDKKLAPLMESVEFINAKYDDLQKRLKLVEDERKTFKSALNSLQDSIRSVAKAQNDLEQYGRRECVEIRGIPTSPDPKTEDTNTIVKEVGKLMGIDVHDSDISTSHRMPQSKRYKGKKPGPPAIIAKFVRRDVKDKYYGARAKLRRASTQSLGYAEGNNIYISESLTVSNRELLNQCLKARRDLDFDYLWTRNGKILMRYDSYSAAQLISTRDDLKKLYGDK